MNSMTTDLENGARQYLGFHVAGEAYGIPILKVREILEYGAVTKVPASPPWIRGVFNLRGSVVPVIDLAVKFGLDPSEVTRKSCIVVVDAERVDGCVALGVLIDEVSSVLEYGAGQTERLPEFGTRVRREFLLGMGAADGQKFVMLLDIDRVLTDDEIIAVRDAGASAQPEG